MITLSYITSRENPMWEWWIEGILKQIPENLEYEIIVVDSFKNNERTQLLSSLSDKIVHLEPKPCPWSGRHRITQEEYFSAANARNTALIAARGEHIVFSDDLSVPAKDFLKYHLEAYDKKIVMVGVQHKVRGLHVDHGDYSYKFGSLDSRERVLYFHGKEPGLTLAMDPAWTYGNNISMPMNVVETVNGFDEIFDGQYGVEDCDLGVRISNADHKIYINPLCVIIESEEHHSRKLFKEKEINNRHANESVCWDARDQKRFWTIGNRFNLQEARIQYRHKGEMPTLSPPIVDWRDGQPLSEM